MKNASTFLLILVFIFLISHIVSANTHTIYVDIKGNDSEKGSFTEPVETVAKAVELAKIINPSEELPVLIKLGLGEFDAPENNWTIDFQWIFFSGNGPENTKLIASKIILTPQTPFETKSLPFKGDLEGCFPITGFKDIYISALLDINDTFLPVNNVKILQLEKTDGQLEGIWYNAVGELNSNVARMSPSAIQAKTQLPKHRHGHSR